VGKATDAKSLAQLNETLLQANAKDPDSLFLSCTSADKKAKKGEEGLAMAANSSTLLRSNLSPERRPSSAISCSFVFVLVFIVVKEYWGESSLALGGFVDGLEVVLQNEGVGVGGGGEEEGSGHGVEVRGVRGERQKEERER